MRGLWNEKKIEQKLKNVQIFICVVTKPQILHFTIIQYLSKFNFKELKY